MNQNSLKSENISQMPDPLASNKEKESDGYGLKIAKAIQSEWFNGGYLFDKKSVFMGRHKWISEMRLYNRGAQDDQKYKDIAARQKSDASYLNLDWTPINVVEKFTNIVRNGISDEYYNLDIRSSDRFAILQQKKKIEKHRENMLAKPMYEKAKAMLGIDMMPKGFIPEDEEELSLYTQIKERPKQEIAEEILVDYIKKTNDWDFIKKKADEDEVVAGIMVGRVYTDPVNGVRIEYVDPEAYGHSYVEKNNFSDAYYHFVVDTITINDLRRESGFDDVSLRKIAKSYANAREVVSNKNYDQIPMETILSERIHVMRFCYKTDKEIVYKNYLDKKNRTRKVAKRDSDFEVPEGHENSRISKRMDTWYEGNYVLGSNEFIYGYKECENIERDEMDRALSPFVVQATNIYKNELRSFLSNIIPMSDQMQLVHLKIQHLTAELKPDLIEIDIDQLAELETDAKGDSKSKNWETALSILQVKGVVLKQRINMGEDGIKDGASARPMGNQQGSALGALLNIWAHYYNLIRETTGVNPAADGSLPSDALVGVNQMMKLAYNTATKHIVDAALSWDKRICETISARVKGIFTHKEAKHIQELYTNAVGKHNVEALEAMKNRHIHEFGYTVNLVPAKEELDELRQDLAISLQEGTIDVSEKSEIMRIARSNIKQANQYMSYLRRRRIKEKMKQDEYNIKLQSQTNAEAAEAKAQAELQAYGGKKQIDLQAKAKEYAMELQKKEAEQQIEAPLKAQEFKQNVFLEQIKNLQTINMAKFKEDAKDQRLKEQSTHQSKLIAQRQKDKEPIDFTGDFDISKILS